MGDNEPGAGAQDPSRSRQEITREPRNWISRHPLLAAILLPVIPGLIVGLIVLVPDKVFDARQDQNSSQTPTSAQQPARTERAAGTPSTSASPTPSTSTEDIRWAGTLNLTYLDLDSVPPRVLSSNSGASAYVSYARASSGKFSKATLYGRPGGFFTTEPTIALWSNSAEPTRQQCSDLISTQAVETLPVSKDSRYCVKTAANRVAFITEISLNDAIHSYTALVTVWSATS